LGIVCTGGVCAGGLIKEFFNVSRWFPAKNNELPVVSKIQWKSFGPRFKIIIVCASCAQKIIKVGFLPTKVES
jgi:hypothetical protein